MPDWTPRAPIPRTPMIVRYVHNVLLEPKRHGHELWKVPGGTRMNAFIKHMHWPSMESPDQFGRHLIKLSKAIGWFRT